MDFTQDIVLFVPEYPLNEDLMYLALRAALDYGIELVEEATRLEESGGGFERCRTREGIGGSDRLSAILLFSHTGGCFRHQ